MAQKTTLKEFEGVYPKLSEAILDHARSYKLPQEELNWLKTVSNSCVFHAVLGFGFMSLVRIGHDLALLKAWLRDRVTNEPRDRTSTPTPSAENAIAACPSPIPSLFFSTPPSTRSNTSKPLLSDG